MSNIQIQISPTDELVDELSELIKFQFLSGLDENFVSPQVEADLDNYISSFRTDLDCVIEYPYVDKVYRDSYYHYYSSKHYTYQRDCIRVSLFEPGIKPEYFLNTTKHDYLSNNYLGYFIIRPITTALFGRALLNPRAFTINNFAICRCKVNSLVYGVKVETEGFPHSSQDGETLKCAETTIWSIMEYFGFKYPEYKPTLPHQIVRALERFSYQRQLPSNGLTMDQISFALKEFSFGTRVYSKDSYGDEIYNIIDCYVESGIPVIIGLESGDLGHAIVAIGKENLTRIDWNNTDKGIIKIKGSDKEYFDSTSITAKYVIHDDNLSPYKLVSLQHPGEHYDDEDCKKYVIDNIVVPLYPKIYLDAVVGRHLALEIIKDDELGFSFGAEFIFRFFLASSRSLKHHVSGLNKMNEKLKKHIILTKMPKFIWCVEIYDKNSFESKGKEAISLIILDATEASQDSIDAFIFAGYPDRCIRMNENNYVSLPLEFKGYTQFNNLK